MRRGKIILWSVIPGVFLCLILFHWYLGTGETPCASMVRQWYFVKRSGHARIYVPENLSFEFPGFICATVIGYQMFALERNGRASCIILLLLLSTAIVFIVRSSREFYPELHSMLIEVESMGSFNAYFSQFCRTMFFGSTGAVVGWFTAREGVPWKI